MRRMMLALLMGLMAAGIVWVNPAHATVPDAVRKALQERFRLSRVAEHGEVVEGRVFNPGTILILQADRIPAKQFRVFRDMSKSPRLHHLRDYAPVTIAADGRLTAAPADFTLNKGTRLVVLDLNVKADRVHLFTHTLEPVRLADGKAGYGCTEFIFPFDPGALEQGDPFAIQDRIEQWLAVASAQ
ncbi:MAG: hypothetical protein ACRERE_40505 [Candidatus Entotheonellia bacterium]